MTPEQREGEPLDVGRIFREHNPRVLSYLSRRLSSRQVAEDLAQDAWIGLIRCVHSHPVDDPVRLLYAIAARRLIDHYRKRAHQQPPVEPEMLERLAESLAAIRADHAKIDTDAIHRLIDIRRALAQLPAHQRQVLILFYNAPATEHGALVHRVAGYLPHNHVVLDHIRGVLGRARLGYHSAAVELATAEVLSPPVPPMTALRHPGTRPMPVATGAYRQIVDPRQLGDTRHVIDTIVDGGSVDALGETRIPVLDWVDPATLPLHRAMFDEVRRLGQRVSGADLMPILAAHTHSLRTMATHARPAVRNAALQLASRYAEYAGWMAQEEGDVGGATWWTGRAVEFAAAGADTEMAGLALVRQALITLYRRDSARTVALAQAAEETPGTSPRIRGLAAQREAQGHALAGDYDSCMRALDRASALLAVPIESAAPVMGTSKSG